MAKKRARTKVAVPDYMRGPCYKCDNRHKFWREVGSEGKTSVTKCKAYVQDQ